MDDIERGQCEQYSRILFGKFAKGKDFEDLIKGCRSYRDFRIHAVQKFANKNETSKKISQRWQGSLAKPDAAPDANLLMHILETLGIKHTDLERQIREATGDLLEKFKTLDTAATAQASWRTNLGDIRLQIDGIRSRLEHLDEMPSRGSEPSHGSVALPPDGAPDANRLLHVLESLVLKHTDLEGKMRDANTDLLEKFKALDTTATALAILRTNSDDMRLQMAGLRSALEHSEEMPSRGGKGTK
jgi:DNA-binding transcriptional MerR regulator